MYTKAQLINLRDMAQRLNIQEDVEHWSSELSKLNEKEKA